MNRGAWSVFVTALCIAAAVFWWRHGVESAPPLSNALPQPQAPVNAESAGVTPPVLVAPASQTTASPLPVEDYAAQLRAATDYLEFARALLPAARAGDHEAQFYLFRALDYCAIEYRAYVDRGSKRRSLEEALTWAATHWPYDAEAVRLIHSRCHTLMETGTKEFGERGEWLRKASDGGFPLAQAVAANRRQLKGVSTTDDVAGRQKESERLLSLAIRSRNPEVIWEIARSPISLQADGIDHDLNHFAWLLAACHRGLDCAAQSEVVMMVCRLDTSCQPYETAADIFRRWRADSFPEIETRARWINEKIDAGDWEALGF
jgi:hypothetical protein